ncbi:hypothetical protein KHA80_01885 [Anaerobacillus sp. HL2]|nr:hypothetical protein KHA80_01885 [Anaerobacillus sp. HL2]
MSNYELAFANNHRMSYIYAPTNYLALPDIAEIAMSDQRLLLLVGSMENG